MPTTTDQHTQHPINDLARIWRPERDQEERPTLVEAASGGTTGHADTEPGDGTAAVTGQRGPGFLLSLLPLVTPIMLILVGTMWNAAAGELPGWLIFVTDKTVALLIGALVAYAVAARTMTRPEMDSSATTAVQSAGLVLLITGAGGAFGAIIEEAGVDTLIADSVAAFGDNYFVALLACYFVGMTFRVAVGSGTVASLTTMTIMASLGSTIGVHPVWVAMACLAGALSLGHINDSGFWVTAKLPGFSVTGGLKTYTLAAVRDVGFRAAGHAGGCHGDGTAGLVRHRVCGHRCGGGVVDRAPGATTRPPHRQPGPAPGLLRRPRHHGQPPTPPHRGGPTARRGRRAGGR